MSPTDTDDVARLEQAIAIQEAEIVVLEAEIHEIQQEISEFEAQYNRIVQPVILRVEAVKEAIQDLEMLQRKNRRFNDQQPIESLWRLPMDEPPPKAEPLIMPEPKPKKESPRLKRLYHQLARRYHPDFASDDADRARRNELMAMINNAYNSGDVEALRLLDDSDAKQKTPQADSRIPLSMLKLRQLEQHHFDLTRRIEDLKTERTNLLHGDLMDLKLQWTVAKSKGRDLLREICEGLETEYGEWMKQLDMLKGMM